MLFDIERKREREDNTGRVVGHRRNRVGMETDGEVREGIKRGWRRKEEFWDS